MSEVIEVKGHTGTIRFDGRMITIVRKGVLARTTVGKGEKQIPLAHVTAVQFKPAGLMVNGYIAFTVGGGVEGDRSSAAKHTTRCRTRTPWSSTIASARSSSASVTSCRKP
jgi:hypothetical protein